VGIKADSSVTSVVSRFHRTAAAAAAAAAAATNRTTADCSGGWRAQVRARIWPNVGPVTGKRFQFDCRWVVLRVPVSHIRSLVVVVGVINAPFRSMSCKGEECSGFQNNEGDSG
jgi:hypothetical protein